VTVRDGTCTILGTLFVPGELSILLFYYCERSELLKRKEKQRKREERRRGERKREEQRIASPID
jgi:hypothetical protein